MTSFDDQYELVMTGSNNLKVSYYGWWLRCALQTQTGPRVSIVKVVPYGNIPRLRCGALYEHIEGNLRLDQYNELEGMEFRLTDLFPGPMVVVWPSGGLEVSLAIIMGCNVKDG